MSRDSDHPELWNWQPPIGVLQCGPLAGRVDVARPQRGLHQLQLAGQSLGGQLLGVTWEGVPDDRPSQVADAYLRAGDLVAAYQPQADWPYAPRIYWRTEPPRSDDAALASLVLWVSVETDRLNTHPTARVESALAADELLGLNLTDDTDVSVQPLAEREQCSRVSVDSACLLWRLPGGRVSCAQFARTGDAQQLRVRPQSSDGNALSRFVCQWELFADFLEKGVIRRACLQSVLVPREDDVARATACWRAFQSRPLPLTA